MRLTAKSLEHLTGIVTGDSRRSPLRSGRQLVDFFNDFGEGDLYGQGFPSRIQFARGKLDKFNGTDTMKAIVSAAFNFIDEDGFDAENAAYQFNHILSHDGFRLTMEHGFSSMQGDKEVRGNPRFEVCPLGQNLLAPTSLVATSHEAILEQVRKANQKIESGDFSGAITNAYTLVEHLLKLLLSETGTTFKETGGDIRALYKVLQPFLNLDPSKLEGPLKPIVGGFQTLIGGLYETANKSSDRHARRFNPARHHAKLAVNAAFALCDFLVESRDYQRARATSASHKEAGALR